MSEILSREQLQDAERCNEITCDVCKASLGKGYCSLHIAKAALYWQDKAEQYRVALDEIANPIKYMRQEAEAKGARLDGGIAIQLSGSANYLQGIARAALAAIEGVKE